MHFRCCSATYEKNSRKVSGAWPPAYFWQQISMMNLVEELQWRGLVLATVYSFNFIILLINEYTLKSGVA